MDASSIQRAYRSLRRRALFAAAITLLSTAIAADLLVTTWSLSPLALGRALAVPIALVALVASRLPLHPHPVLGPANQITLVRAIVVAGLAAFVFEAQAVPRWGLVGACGLAFGMDAVDGWLARRSGTASEFGAQLDMELDGIFVLVLCGLAATVTGAGAWVWAAGLARYAFVAAAAVLPWMGRPLPPTRRRPWACGLGVGLLVASLAPLPMGIPLACAALGVAAIVGSFAIDVVWLAGRRP